MEKRFEGKVALVTGASSGIGKATAERLGAEGARVVCADVQAEALEGTTKTIVDGGGEAISQLCDVSDPQAVRAAVQAGVDRFGALHVLCNVAGILRFEHTHEASLADWNQVLAVNLTGTFLVCQAAIPHLLQTGGSIVNVSSTAALKGHPWTAAYSASKGGVLALTYALAIEYGQQGLRVNAVCPGAVETPMHQAFQVPEGADGNLINRIFPFVGFEGPEQAASVIVFLASADARHVNGSMLRIDGAMCT